MPFISVIIPLFNKEKFIQKTIQSVLNQSFKDFEIIIVNDGSTDDSSKLAFNFKSSKITLIHQENKGLSAARNNGISKANGSIIALLDADDIWLPNYLEVIKQLHDNFSTADIFGTSYYEQRGNRKHLINTSLPKNMKGENFILDDFFKANLFQFIPCHSTISFKKSIISKKPYNEGITYGEDVDFYLTFCEKHNVAISNVPLAIVNFGLQGQMSKSKISSKKIPDLDYFQTYYKKNSSIQKYIDIQRYKLAIKYIEENNLSLKKTMVNKITKSHLSRKQNLLLRLPRRITLLLRFIKLSLLKFNIRLTTN